MVLLQMLLLLLITLVGSSAAALPPLAPRLPPEACPCSDPALCDVKVLDVGSGSWNGSKCGKNQL